MKQPNDNLIGESSQFLEVLEQASLLAPLNKPILIIGERGTGKELIAARLHYLSNRWDQPLVKLNCSAINENLLETELFGHESGAFTGASKRHLGRFELADNGTLFLDEIGNSSQNVQEKLLRVIEYGEFERVGGNKTIAVNVRVVAATNEDLPLQAKRGLFRADLLDRLAFDVINLPPLRYRVNDIMILAQHFAVAMTHELERDFFAGFSEQATQQLNQYPWPGNVRELKNVVERNVYKSMAGEGVKRIQFDPFESPYRSLSTSEEATSEQRTIQSTINAQSISESTRQAADLSETSLQSGSSVGEQLERANSQRTQSQRYSDKSDLWPIDFKKNSGEFEIDLIQQALKKAQFNQKKCADLLGLTYHQLRGYLKKYQLL